LGGRGGVRRKPTSRDPARWPEFRRAPGLYHPPVMLTGRPALSLGLPCLRGRVEYGGPAAVNDKGGWY
jgi:hypothetical protein